MNKIRLMLFILLTTFFNISFSFAQNDASVKWSLTSDLNVSSIDGNLIAENLVLSYSDNDPTLNLQVRDYTTSSGSGLRLNVGNTNWPRESAENSGRYIEFSVKPEEGYGFKVTSIKLDLGGGGTSHMKANLYYSTDSTFAERTKLNDRPDLPNSAWINPSPNYVLNNRVHDDETFYFRIYVWYQEVPSQTKYIWIRNVVISGITYLEGELLAPNVITLPVSNITNNGALTGGNVISDGGDDITERGVCWNASGNPTIDDFRTIDGTGLGEFTSNITGLTFATRYYIRAYATNSVGTSYGNELNFIAIPRVPAFPGAEGAGMWSLGGRAGDVYEVINLNNSGPGSIVDALSQGNRTVIFRVSGTIELQGVILRPKSFTTIAGQTAPGDGITIKGRMIIASQEGRSVTDVVVRFIRIRVDEGAANSSGDAIDIVDGENIIIDHVSASYARDEGISCQEQSDKVSVQWCIISEGLTFESHSYGSLVRGDHGDTKSYHYNLYAHNHSRNPRPGNYTQIANDSLGLFFDFRNNVVYNWKGSEPGYNDDRMTVSRYNFIGNYFVTGQESPVTNRIFKENSLVSYGYFRDNAYNGNVPDDAWSLVRFNNFTQAQVDDYKARSYEVPMEPVTTFSPEKAKSLVLAKAGSSFPKRDIIDERIVNDVLTGTGRSIMRTTNQPEGAWPLLNSLPAPLDTDKDGIPDEWEIANGLDPNDPSDGSAYTISGYTNLEIYLNHLVEDIMTSVENEVEIPSNFALHQNYPNPFNPVTTIEYYLPKEALVKLEVFDALGRRVAILDEGNKPSGFYKVNFDASRFASGLYIYRLNADQKVFTKKMLLLK